MKWISKSYNIDIETGEVINNKNKKNYIKTKTIKHAKKTQNRGTIEYTNEYKKLKYKQPELPLK